ncbi:MAG: APC family permease, partial [Alphaproteobacteria bacterium]|nr:APC family permease [Alphaproteobacteria bacterium]
MSNDLRKSLSLPMLAALGAAGAIGSSWVYTASNYFHDYGAGGEIFGLMLGALLAICVALAYAELAARFPRAGGEVVFAFAAFGRAPAFVAGWLLIGAYVSSLAFYVTATGMLLSELYPGLKSMPLYSIAGTDVYLPVLAIGVGLCLVVWFLTSAGMGLAGGLQLLLFGAMVCIGLALVGVGFSTGRLDNFWPPFGADHDPITSTVRFVLPAMTFLTGFSLITALAEDANLPPRRIGVAVVATVAISATFYCTVLLATAWLIPWEKTAALDDGVIGAFRDAGYPALAWGAYGISVLGLMTSFLALFPAASRLVLALARGGLFPPALARLSDSGRPINA